MKVVVTPRAGRQMRAAVSYISRERPNAALAVQDRISRALEMIGEYPEIGRRSAAHGARELAVPRTPYIVIYRISDCVEVLSILHGRQDR